MRAWRIAGGGRAESKTKVTVQADMDGMRGSGLARIGAD